MMLMFFRVAVAVLCFLSPIVTQAANPISTPARTTTKAIDIAPRAITDEGLPLWELGIGAVGAYTADYPAAGQNHFNAAPIPVIIYRGDFLRVGDGSVARGRIVKTDRFEFDFSFDGSFPAESEDNDARQGMPDLDFLLEVGPALKIVLARAARDAKIDLEIPLRAAFSTDLTSVDYRGIVFNPKLKYSNENFLGKNNKFSVSIGPAFATAELMDFFYEVEPQFVRTGRSAYQAEGGYLGSRINVGFGMPITDRVRGFIGGSLGYYGGAANESSPLFKDDLNLSGGVGFIWSIFHSDRRAPKD